MRLTTQHKIFPSFRLGQEFPLEMRAPPIFPPAAYMRYGNYPAVLEPSDVFGIKERILRNAIRAVPSQKRGIRSIEFYALSVHDRKGDECSIVALGFYFHRLQVSKLVKLSHSFQLVVRALFPAL